MKKIYTKIIEIMVYQKHRLCLAIEMDQRPDPLLIRSIAELNAKAAAVQTRLPI